MIAGDHRRGKTHGTARFGSTRQATRAELEGRFGTTRPATREEIDARIQARVGKVS